MIIKCVQGHLGSIGGDLGSIGGALGSIRGDLGLPRVTSASARDEVAKNLGFGPTLVVASRTRRFVYVRAPPTARP
jgi:hypothetical protein